MPNTENLTGVSAKKFRDMKDRRLNPGYSLHQPGISYPAVGRRLWYVPGKTV